MNFKKKHKLTKSALRATVRIFAKTFFATGAEIRNLQMLRQNVGRLDLGLVQIFIMAKPQIGARKFPSSFDIF